jgi:hypothetical protein
MIEFNHLRDLHSLDVTEEDRDRSWGRSKMIKYCDKKEEDGSNHHKCLVEWNDISKIWSWTYFFALSLCNSIPVF